MVPPYAPKPNPDPLTFDPTKSHSFIIFDTETTCTGKHEEICQLSAINETNLPILSRYRAPFFVLIAACVVFGFYWLLWASVATFVASLNVARWQTIKKNSNSSPLRFRSSPAGLLGVDCRRAVAITPNCYITLKSGFVKSFASVGSAHSVKSVTFCRL